MSLQVIFLGTAASIPTPRRALSAVALKREGELLLFDCGEGTQRQMISARIGFNRKTKIFLTHMHGDHVLGLPGILQTMSLLGRDKPLSIFGPPGIKAFVEAIIRTVKFGLSFEIEVYEIDGEGVVHEDEKYQICAARSDHSIPSLAYALIEKPRPGRFYPQRAITLGIPEGALWSKLQHGHEVELPNGRKARPHDVMGPPRPGRKIAYTGDTKPSQGIVKLAEGAELLIHEATFADDLKERAAEEYHSTAGQAAEVAKEARVKLLVLTHISSRYEDPTVLLEQAEKIFPNSRVAEDLMRIDIPFHRDAPREKTCQTSFSTSSLD